MLTFALISHTDKVMLKILQPGFSHTWTMNFQMFKVVLENAEDPEIELPTSAGSSKKQESSRETSTSDLLTMSKPLTVWITINCGKFWIPDYLTYLLRNLYAGQEGTVRIGQITTDWFQKGKGVHQGCILSPCLFIFYAEYIVRNAGLEEAQAQAESRLLEKYQLSQICRWHHPYGRKWRRTKKPLDESERGEWKSWLKAQHSES